MSNTGKPRKPEEGRQIPGVTNHVSAEDVLPEDLLRSVQVYFRGGRLYVPSPSWNLARDEAICESYRKGKEAGEPAGRLSDELAKQFGISPRRIQQITSDAGLRESERSKRKRTS
jgi:hypothetical protein